MIRTCRKETSIFFTFLISSIFISCCSNFTYWDFQLISIDFPPVSSCPVPFFIPILEKHPLSVIHIQPEIPLGAFCNSGSNRAYGGPASNKEYPDSYLEWYPNVFVVFLYILSHNDPFFYKKGTCKSRCPFVCHLIFSGKSDLQSEFRNRHIQNTDSLRSDYFPPMRRPLPVWLFPYILRLQVRNPASRSLPDQTALAGK